MNHSYNQTVKVSVAEAKNTLPRLIRAVEGGESVTIYRHGTPVADLVRTNTPDPEKPKFGTLKGKVTALAPDWWKPMTDDEVQASGNVGASKGDRGPRGQRCFAD